MEKFNLREQNFGHEHEFIRMFYNTWLRSMNREGINHISSIASF